MFKVLLTLPPWRPKEGWWGELATESPCPRPRESRCGDPAVSCGRLALAPGSGRFGIWIRPESRSLSWQKVSLFPRRERHPSCLTYLWVIFKGSEKWQGKEGELPRRHCWPGLQLLARLGETRPSAAGPVRVAGLLPPSSCRPLPGSRGVPASFSEVVGERYFFFF